MSQRLMSELIDDYEAARTDPAYGTSQVPPGRTLKEWIESGETFDRNARLLLDALRQTGPLVHRGRLWQAVESRYGHRIVTTDAGPPRLRRLRPRIPGRPVMPDHNHERHAAARELLRESMAVDPAVRVGIPTLKGTRITVGQLIAEIADDDRVNEVAADFDIDPASLRQLMDGLSIAFDIRGGADRPRPRIERLASLLLGGLLGIRDGLRRRRIRRLVRDLRNPQPGVSGRAVESLRNYLRMGLVSVTTAVIERLDDALRDDDDRVRWNAVNVLVDLGPRLGRPVPTDIRSVVVDSDGQVRLEAKWNLAATAGAQETTLPGVPPPPLPGDRP